MKDDIFGNLYRSDDPRYSDPRFQRRVLEVTRPVVIVENLHEVKLECGHEPTLMGDMVPKVGEMFFCPKCYEEADEIKPKGV